jgi:tetratricopeptide (TPR) repeat protein
MKYSFFIFLLWFPVLLIGQIPPVSDGQQILSHLKDSARIDKMNELCLECFGRIWKDSTEYKALKDSAEIYSGTAYRESQAIHYIYGVALSLARQGKIATQFNVNFQEAEKLYEESISWYEKTNNKNYLSDTYGELSFAQFSQSKYDLALRSAEICYSVASKAKDESGMAGILGLISQIHLKRGEFDLGFEAAQQSLKINQRSGIQSNIHNSLLGLGSICMGIEDYGPALVYYRKVLENYTKEDSLEASNDEDFVWTLMEYAEIFSHLGMFDSALYRYNLFDTSKAPDKDLRVFLVSKGEYFMLTGQYREALPGLLRGLAFHKKFNDGNEIVRTVLDIANTYFALHETDKALRYAREGLSLGLQTHARQRMRDAYKVIYQIYDQRGKTDSAYFYYRAYIQTKESLTDDQTKGKFAVSRDKENIELLSKEKLINQQKLKIQEQQLKSEAVFRNILIIFACTIMGVSFLFLRNINLKRRNEKLISQNIQRKLEHETSEMEMQALRAQMNPHFIFNCLNSINRFIMKNESQAASDYLTQFSRLIRLVLNNSKKTWIPLEDEIEMLGLYLDMEKLRFKDAFSYSLLCDDDTDPASIFVPPLLLQPFVENAIWHGLMHKKENGLLTLFFKKEKDILLCTVVDNGVGRAVAAAARSKSSQSHKSMGIKITRERLALINGDSLDNQIVSFKIEDVVDAVGQIAGTRVSVNIRYQENYESRTETKTSIKLTDNDQIHYS